MPNRWRDRLAQAEHDLGQATAVTAAHADPSNAGSAIEADL